MRKAKYWYKIEHEECPVCGERNTIKYRQYTPKPIWEQDRVKFVEQYDHCLEQI